jgi:hypothetical protein
MQATWISWTCACVVLLARSRPGGCRRPSPRCTASAPGRLFKFVVAIVGGAGVGSVSLLEGELARRGGVAEDRITDADRRLFWRCHVRRCASETCVKDAEIMIMRQNARFRSSWEPGGDLITLTVRVAGATVQ